MTNRATRLIAIVLGLLVASQSFGQVKFNIGMNTGLNMGTISYDPDPFGQGVTKSGRMGFGFGAQAELGFADMFFVSLQPRYIMKGNSFEQGTAKLTRSLNELEIPILFKVKFIKGTVRPYAFVGPNIGLVLSAKDKYEGTQNDGEVDTKDQISGSDFALDFGGGTEFWIAKTVALTGDVRYSMGLSNLIKNPVGNATAKARGFQILFGVLFGL
ncbi:PorT family protein [Sphingobacteriales bacterium CHB3]|nr:PorT family protein [Sphingobacteriales bacterium CHB3]